MTIEKLKQTLNMLEAVDIYLFFLRLGCVTCSCRTWKSHPMVMPVVFCQRDLIKKLFPDRQFSLNIDLFSCMSFFWEVLFFQKNYILNFNDKSMILY